MNQLDIRNHPDFDHHELVEVQQSKHLSAMIAVHNTNLGPAVGGCRMFSYVSTTDALADVLRLSRGMTYKSALAGIPLGGGKSVIIGDPRTDKTPGLLHAMGDFVDSLRGRYVTAEDSGTSVADIAAMGERTRFVSGVAKDDQFGGDPSPLTAYGVFVGIREALAHRGCADLENVRVAVQGVGNVGMHLTKMLIRSGAKVVVADVCQRNVIRAGELGADIVDPSEIHAANVDVFAPCALGGAINRDTVRDIRAGIVAGAANNQLTSKEMGGLLLDRGILYAPDYVINAGGIIDVYYQQQGDRNHDRIAGHIDRIGETLRHIFQASDLRLTPTGEVADEMAEAIFNHPAAGGKIAAV